jgi:hypothetical protein
MMRRLPEHRFSLCGTPVIFMVALTISGTQGVGASLPAFLSMEPSSVAILHGPSIPPDPWDGLRVAHGPSIPPDPWDGLRIAHGPSIPPDPWDGLRLAA